MDHKTTEGVLDTFEITENDCRQQWDQSNICINNGHSNDVDCISLLQQKIDIFNEFDQKIKTLISKCNELKLNVLKIGDITHIS